MDETSLLQEECRIKENRTQDILVNLNSYLKLASFYIAKNDNNEELFHRGILIDSMQKGVSELMEIYDLVSTEEQ